MLIIDNITIVIWTLLVLLSIMSIVADAFIRRIKVTDECTETAAEPVSIVIIADNNAREIERNLDAFLCQDYPAGYEVIVVISKDEDGTKDVLKTFKGYENLYVTFVPNSSRYMSIRKLAVTLGVKAAKHEWILLTDADCKPNSERWISKMMASRSGVNMVTGYCNYDGEATDYQRFDRFYREYTFMREASKGHAYATASQNLLFKKSMFMDNRGFLGNLKYLRGEYAFLVNKYAEYAPVAVCADIDGGVTEQSPTKKEWRNANMFYAETRHHLAHGFRHRLSFNFDMSFLYVVLLAAVGSAAYSALTERWLIMPVSALALICPFVFRTFNAKRAMSSFNVGVPLWKVVPFELYILWHNIRNMIRYKFADKYDFISHKS